MKVATNGLHKVTNSISCGASERGFVLCQHLLINGHCCKQIASYKIMFFYKMKIPSQNVATTNVDTIYFYLSLLNSYQL